MERISSLIPSMLVALCAVGTLVGTSAGAEEMSASASLHAQRAAANGIGYEEPTDKRAYTYVSEYKRLPVYNFGIGKRWLDNADEKRSRTYSFGLGKRVRSYDFGLGKRSGYGEYRPIGLTSLDYLLPFDGYEAYRTRDDVDEETSEDEANETYERKRAGYAYRFGLGKRATWAGQESIGTGKRPNEDVLHRYNFGIGKRDVVDDESRQ